ncbi:MAG: VWA domain-containing protein [bacterium]|nr:VWA domain-containing protein [bacterium]
MVDFIRALRAAGVRISLAESQDAMYGVDLLGVHSADSFRSTLKTTLVKESRDHTLFDYFFPLFFASNTPPMQNIPDNLTPEEQQMLEQALRSLAGQMEALKQLLQQMLNGQPFSDEQLQDMGDASGLSQANDMYQRQWFERRMNRQAGMQQLQQMIEQLLETLEQMGMSQESLDALREMMQQNMEGMSDQISNYVGTSLAEQMANQEPQPKPDLMDVPFNRLGDSEIKQIRDEIRRLAAKLRSRAALRQRRSKVGTPDPRRTFRANMKYGGTPVELKYRTKHVKPALVLICDVSTSVRYCAEFLLTLIYELQDQVQRTNSFIFISDLVDISMEFKESDPQEAVQRVLSENRPGYYNTDLGASLDTFQKDHMGLLTSKTTVIILGDGRNNYNNPRLDIASDMQRRSRRLIWFCPEHPSQWGTGDSDMDNYARESDGVFYVNTLRDLASAVDKILADG